MTPDNFGSRVDRALSKPEASMPAQLPWTAASVSDEVHEALVAPIADAPRATGQSAAEPARPHDLERRVEGLERLLQALLVQLGKAERDLLVRLRKAFAASSPTARSDDDKATDAAALALVDAALSAAGEGEEPSLEAARTSRAGPAARPAADGLNDQSSFRPPSFHYRKVGGIWRLTMDRPQRPVSVEKKR